jgi:bifunctional DNA-binding transcriptional regulator/antitoxin component of YhaV-PrlF toxin-antitoxin module
MTYLVGTKGQVVIAKEIRDRLGVKPGWVALQRLVGDRVEIYFLPPEHHESLKGSLAGYLKASIPAGEAWDRARETAWQAAARESGAQEPET